MIRDERQEGRHLVHSVHWGERRQLDSGSTPIGPRTEPSWTLAWVCLGGGQADLCRMPTMGVVVHGRPESRSARYVGHSPWGRQASRQRPPTRRRTSQLPRGHGRRIGSAGSRACRAGDGGKRRALRAFIERMKGGVGLSLLMDGVGVLLIEAKLVLEEEPALLLIFSGVNRRVPLESVEDRTADQCADAVVGASMRLRFCLRVCHLQPFWPDFGPGRDIRAVGPAMAARALRCRPMGGVGRRESANRVLEGSEGIGAAGWGRWREKDLAGEGRRRGPGQDRDDLVHLTC